MEGPRLMLIVLMVTYCMNLNPTMCRELEVAPIDHPIASIAECLHGGAVAGMEFELDHIEWHTRGWHCVERPNPVEAWIRKGD